MNTSVPVVVMHQGGGALAIARSLGRLGVPAYLVTQRGLSPVASSRYWRKRFWWDFSAPPEESLRFLLEVGRRIGSRPVLLTLADWAAIFIEDHAAALQEHFRFPAARQPIIRALADKWQLFLTAKKYGIPTPETVMPRSRDDVLAFARVARFPIMVKGADRYLPGGASLDILRNSKDLLQRYDRAAEHGANLVLQEYIPGEADSVWMCNAYFDAKSECRAVFTGRKLRQSPPHTGIASLAVCLPNDTVARQTRELMQAVGYQGCVGIGWRYDARDGKYKVLDVNPRVSGVFRLFRATNGMDVVRICYLDLTGQRAPASELAVGRKWLLEDDIFASIHYAREGKLTFRRWLHSLRGVRETHWFAADDPAPIFVWLWLKLWTKLWALASALPRRLRGRTEANIVAPSQSPQPAR